LNVPRQKGNEALHQLNTTHEPIDTRVEQATTVVYYLLERKYYLLRWAELMVLHHNHDAAEGSNQRLIKKEKEV
jgi:hypothetical protein